MISTSASASEGYQNDAEVAEEVVNSTLTEEMHQSWGDDIHTKSKQHFRIATININGLPQQRQHPKYGTLREQVTTHHIDIIGVSETNLKWNRFSCYDRMAQRTSKWRENTHCTYSYNIHDVSTSKF